MIWTRIQRDAPSVLSKQNDRLIQELDRYKSLRENCHECKELFLNPSDDFLREFGKLLDKTWQTKRKLEKSISSDEIDEIHTKIGLLGGYGGKLSGAGGGGFFFEIVPQQSHATILNYFGSGRVLKVAHEPTGSRLLSEVY